MNKLKISGTVSFQEACQDRWQTVYSSSLYGTMFTILGKFKYDKEKKTLTICKLRLVNYKGMIDLGMENVEYQFDRKWAEVSEKNSTGGLDEKLIRVISINVQVRGLIPNVEKTLEGEYVLTDCDLKNDVYLEIDRFLLELNDGGGHKEKGVFDTEFYYRDGDRTPEAFDTDYRQAVGLNPTVEARCVTERIEGEEVNRIERSNIIETQNESIADRSPGAVCPKGYSKIIF
ncbi:hypothetical protein [uncultured Kordia sp.]|uniref:hypothetical protein n=1 Tax=uncultured Kordia sp. TaxID=507699 RepID=UPI00260CBCEC|nr:hypothetical protein [uncultured Kordia sp.]